MSDHFDWHGLLRAGVLALGLKPDEFWSLTPAELRLLLGEGQGERPMARARLDELLEAFPDGMENAR